jgi:hypothetical protein
MVAASRQGFDPYGYLLGTDTGAPSSSAQHLAEVYARFSRGEQPVERGGRPPPRGFTMAEVVAADKREKAYEATLTPEALAKRRAAFAGQAAQAHAARRAARSPLGVVSSVVSPVASAIGAATRPIGRTGIAKTLSRTAKNVTKPIGRAYGAVEHTAVGHVLGTLFTPPIINLVPGAKQAFSGVVSSAAHGNVRGVGKGLVKTGTSLAPVVAQQLKGFGPIGQAAAGGVMGLSTAVQGGSLEDIGWASAEGAAPNGISNAIHAAHQLRQGGNVTDALVSMGKNIIPGTEAHLGFGAATKVLTSTAGSAAPAVAATLGATRRALPSDQARRGFDLALGTVSRAARQPTGKPFAGPRVKIGQSPPNLPMAVSTSERRAARILEVHPALGQATLSHVARTLGVSPTTARRALAAVRHGLHQQARSDGCSRRLARYPRALGRKYGVRRRVRRRADQDRKQAARHRLW